MIDDRKKMTREAEHRVVAVESMTVTARKEHANEHRVGQRQPGKRL